MTLQRRVLLYLALCAPLVWAGGLLFGLNRARFEIGELFDTQQVMLAREVAALLPDAALGAVAAARLPPAAVGGIGDAEVDSLAIAVWDRQGRLLLSDSEGARAPFVPQGDGFIDQEVDGQPWRIYYLPAADGRWLVAVGQEIEERDELVRALLASQLLPWVLTLPVLLLAMAAAVRQALSPVRSLALSLRQRRSDDLRALPLADLPQDLQPLVKAMNGLLLRLRQTLEHERRFTADAAHELRTPLAALQAQWDAARLLAVQRGRPSDESDAKIGEGLQRLGRLVAQMLALSRLDHQQALRQSSPIDWPALVATAFSDVLPQAERRQVELCCDWPPEGVAPLLREGDPELLTVMLRNLLDNAVGHSPQGAAVRLCFAADAIEVIDAGAGVPPESLPRLGERFFRLATSPHSGSGLGLSIAQRIAALHGLRLAWRNLPQGGLCARIERGDLLADT